MITGLNHITLAVSDIDESFAFYSEVLGFKPVQKSRKSAYLLAGDLWVALARDKAARNKPLPEYTHIAFTVSESEFPLIKERFTQAGIGTWQENSTEGDSFYFLDPNGHKLEIHASNLESRIRSGKKEWGKEVQWYV